MKRNIICCLLFLALCASAKPYFLTIRNGTICYCMPPDGAWVNTGVCASSLPHAEDRSLLSDGIYFPNRAALTRALEDFCS